MSTPKATVTVTAPKADKTQQLVSDLEALIAEAAAAAADGRVTLGEALAILGAAVKLVSHLGKRKKS